MSATFVYAGGSERPNPKRLTTTGQTVVYTAADRDVTVATIGLANETASAVVVDVYWKNGTTSFLVWRGSVAASGSSMITDLPMRMYVGDTVEVTAATANAITVFPVCVRSQSHTPAIPQTVGSRGFAYR